MYETLVSQAMFANSFNLPFLPQFGKCTANFQDKHDLRFSVAAQTLEGKTIFSAGMSDERDADSYFRHFCGKGYLTIKTFNIGGEVNTRWSAKGNQVLLHVKIDDVWKLVWKRKATAEAPLDVLILFS